MNKGVEKNIIEWNGYSNKGSMNDETNTLVPELKCCPSGPKHSACFAPSFRNFAHVKQAFDNTTVMGAAHSLGQPTIGGAIYFLKFDSCNGLLDVTWI